MMLEDSCSACRYWLEEQCRRNPPQMLAIVGPPMQGPSIPGILQPQTKVHVEITGVWPRMEPTQWCGEFSPLREQVLQ